MKDDRPTIPAGVALVLAEAKAPTFATKEDVRDQLQPILTLCVQLQKQVAEHRGRILDAQLAHPEVGGQLEHLHQTLGALDGDLKGLLDHARRVWTSALQYERYSADFGALFSSAIDAPSGEVTS